MGRARAAAIAAAMVFSVSAAGAKAAPGEGMSLFGDLKYKPGFTHFDYTNPEAPKGGTMRYSAIGTFDTLNPFVIKGVPAAGINLTFDTLAAAAADEPASEYGLVAAGISVAIIAVIQGLGNNLKTAFSSLSSTLK